MITDDEEANPLRTFGEELRAHRKRANMSQAEVAAELLVSTSLETAIENGRRLPKRQIAETSDKLFGAPGTFMRLWNLVARHSHPLRCGPYVELEADAIRIHVWEMRLVPGLLQTEDYARAVIGAGMPNAPDGQIENDVTGRMARQQIFTKDDPPLVWFVIDESVLYRTYGGAGVMRTQLEKLAAMAKHPNVVIQLLPFGATDHPGGGGPFIVFEFDDAQPVVYAEGRGSGRLIESLSGARDAMACYDHIRAAALGPSATLDFIKKSDGSKWN